MIRRITLHNYMSHADTVIEPATGLTVLVGPNNCGKSAVVSALDTLCNNATGDYMVRHAEKEATVTVETDDGHVLVWRRKGSTVSYVIDGREIHRLNRAVPDELQTLLRLPKVDAGENGEPFDVHFGPQKSPIFLLNEPGSRAALFFASSSDAAILLEMQKQHRGKVKDRKVDERRLKGEIAGLDAELGALDPLDGLTALLGKADHEYQALRQLEREIETLDEKIETLRDHSVEHDHIMRRCQLLASLAVPPDLADTGSLDSLIAALVGSERQVRREAEQCGVLQSLDAPPALDDAEKLQSFCKTLSDEEKNRRRFEAKMFSLRPLSRPPAMDETTTLQAMIGKLDSAELSTGRVRRRQQMLQRLTAPPPLADPKPLTHLIGQLKDTLRTVTDHQGTIRDTATQITKVETAIRAAEAATSSRSMSGLTRNLTRRPFVLAAGGVLAIGAVVLLLIFALSRLSNPNRNSSTQPDDGVAPNAVAAAKSDGSVPARKPLESEPAAVKSIPSENPAEARKEPPKNQERKQELPKETPEEKPRKTEPKEQHPKEMSRTNEPKQSPSERSRNEPPTAAKNLRMRQVRQLLNDAEMARERGKHLDAVLGLGQAAILYPEELAEVEDPEKVRLKFVDALKQCQAQVEQALQKAAEHQKRSN